MVVGVVVVAVRVVVPVEKRQSRRLSTFPVKETGWHVWPSRHDNAARRFDAPTCPSLIRTEEKDP